MFFDSMRMDGDSFFYFFLLKFIYIYNECVKSIYIFLSQDSLFIFLSLFEQMRIHFHYIFKEGFYIYNSNDFFTKTAA